MKIHTKITLGAIATTLAIVGGIVYFTPVDYTEEMLTGHITIPVEIPKTIEAGLTFEDIKLLDYEVKQIDTIHPEKPFPKDELWGMVVEKIKERKVREKQSVKIGKKSLSLKEYKEKRAILINKL